MSIYVEIQIGGRLDELWDKTQTPNLHQLWDLRFTQIAYLPRPDMAQPQRFRYTTRIGLGMCIRGEGETAGSRDGPQGQRRSALKFWSDDRKSLIRTGSGYWKYIPLPGGVRFLTRYDYHTRFGLPGQLFDRLIFRPLMGWATAWSFDRLRLWIERDINPAESLRRSLIHGAARVVLAGWWLAGSGPAMLMEAGWLPVALGIALLLSWHIRWALLLNSACVLLAAFAVASPAFMLPYIAAFTLSLLGYAVAAELPSARRCLRKPQEQE
jgi:hypothetical protein